MYHESKSWPVTENGQKYDRMTTFDRINCLFYKYSSIFKHQAEKINKLVWNNITTTIILIKWPKISGRWTLKEEQKFAINWEGLDKPTSVLIELLHEQNKHFNLNKASKMISEVSKKPVCQN